MTKQVRKCIATRVPPGDRWSLVDYDDTVYESLTETLEAYFQQSKYRGEFILAPLEGKLFILEEKETTPPPPKKFDLYGDQ